ncbi:MAG: zinc dependent phospholipase C family protein [Pseudomonadota bacterium]
MPALLLHMTIAKGTSLDKSAPVLVAEAAREAEGAFLLGSVLCDLAYHSRFWRQCVKHVIRRPYLESHWGDLMHKRGTGTLAYALLAESAKRKCGKKIRGELISLAAGYLSHHAVDGTVHPAIVREVEQRQKHSNLASIVLHSEIERYQSLFFHLDLLGYDIMGSSYPRDLVKKMDGSGFFKPRLAGHLWQAFEAAMIETHGCAPSLSEMNDWLRGVFSYGYLVSSPVGRWFEGLKGNIEEVRRNRFLGPKVDMFTPLKQAMDKTLEYWQAAEDLLLADPKEKGGREEFLHRVPNLPLDGTSSLENGFDKPIM